ASAAVEAKHEEHITDSRGPSKPPEVGNAAKDDPVAFDVQSFGTCTPTRAGQSAVKVRFCCVMPVSAGSTVSVGSGSGPIVGWAPTRSGAPASSEMRTPTRPQP